MNISWNGGARERLGVGIIGLQADRGWAARAHVLALRSLAADFEIVGVANSTIASAERAAAEAGIAKAFGSVDELVASADVDIVAITVRVPSHFAIAKAALEAGKHVYCEWPLGKGLTEAKEMAALARRHKALAVVGTQALFAPEIQYLKQLVAEGFIGELLSTSLVGRGGPLQGSGTIPDSRNYGYLLDRSNGATLLTIPVGHTLAAVQSALGEIAAVSAVLASRRPTALVLESGERLPVTSPDEVLVSGVLAGGAPLSIHYTGGAARDEQGMRWEIHGSEGEIRVTAPSGHAQMVPLSLSGSRGGDKIFHPLEVPQSYRSGWPEDSAVGSVARLYAAMARDLRDGGRSAPTFEDAVALHRVIAAIEIAAETGTCTMVHRPGPEPLPATPARPRTRRTARRRGRSPARSR